MLYEMTGVKVTGDQFWDTSDEEEQKEALTHSTKGILKMSRQRPGRITPSQNLS